MSHSVNCSMEIRYMHRHFDTRITRKFWLAETTFFIYAKLFPYTISNSESQTPLLRFLLRGGGGGVYTQANRYKANNSKQ